MFHYPDKNQAVFKNFNLLSLKKNLICLLFLNHKRNFYFLNFLSGSAEIINCFFMRTCTVSVDSLCGKSVQSLKCNTAFAPL